MSVSGLSKKNRRKTTSDGMTAGAPPAAGAPPPKKPRKQAAPPLRPFAVGYFEELVEAAGLRLAAHAVDCEPLEFCARLKSAFENNDSFPRNVAEFARGLDLRCGGASDDADDEDEDEEEVDSMISKPLSVRAPSDSSSDSDSPGRPLRHGVLRLLLGVSCLQEALVDFAMRRATRYAIENRPDRLQAALKPFVLLENMTAAAEARLADGLVRLLEVGTKATRLEVVVCLPDVVSEAQHGRVASALCDSMTEDYELTPAILDCLAYFCLSAQLRADVRDRMLVALRTTAPPRIFPHLVTFFAGGRAEEGDGRVVRALRDNLDWTTDDAEARTSQLTTALALKAAFRKSKNLSAHWLKAIQDVKLADDHKPLDFVVPLVLYSLRSGKEKTIENLFRKRIKQGLFTDRLAAAAIDTFEPVVREHLAEFTRLAVSLLRAKFDAAVKSFAINCLVTAFAKMSDSRRTIVDELLHHELVEEPEHLANSIAVLSKIADDDIESLKPFSIQMMSLVSKIYSLPNSEISLAMNLLCALAFGVQNSMLQDDVHILIRKQISSFDANIKCRGIAGGVMAIKHLISIKIPESPQEGVDYTDIGNLPEGPTKEAALIIELMLKSILRFPEMICYFNDELANTLLTCKVINGFFLIWLTDKISDMFQSKFISELEPKLLKSIHGISISCQYCLNDTEEVEEPSTVLSIANLVLGENPENIDLRVLPSLFHLMQVVCKKGKNNDLFSIGAVLGCGIIMPVVSDENSLDEFNPEFIERILYCFYYCINWFRELLSAFSSQEDEQIKKKTLARLNGLIILERAFYSYICNGNIDFKPPISMFNAIIDFKPSQIVNRDFKLKKPTKVRKTNKKKTQNDLDTSLPNDTLKSQDASMSSTRSNKPISNPKSSSNVFRNLDFDIINIIGIDFVIEELNDNSSNSLEERLNTDSLLFILEQINPILVLALPSRNKSVHHFSKPAQSSIADKDKILHSSIAALPKLMKYYEQLKEYLSNKLKESDDIRDASSMFTELVDKVQICSTLIFNFIATILSWFGLHLPENKQLLLKCYNILANKANANAKVKQPLKELVKKSCLYFSEFQECCLSISTAAALIKLLRSMVISSNDNAVNECIAEVSSKMLSLTWRDGIGNVEKGFHFNQQIDALLAGYFCKADLNAIKTLSLELSEQCAELTTKNSVLSNFQCINKTNFPLLFRALYQALYETTKNKIESGLTDRQHLDVWMDAVMVMKMLKDILRSQDNRSNITVFLKKSIPLLKLFLSHGMPMMNLQLKSDPDYVVKILKTLQVSTRFLHSLHCHSRIKKDTALIAYLPQMKLLLETLVYKVKASLTMNNCSEAFWMGNLINKNLQGEVVSSQSTVASEKDDDEDQLPDDENSFSDSDCESVKSVSNIC